MEAATKLPPELQELVIAGTLRDTGDNEYSIDSLTHRGRTGTGFSTVMYDLRIDDYDEGGPTFEVVEWTRELGNDVLISTEDPDEAAYFITNLIEEMED